MLPAVAAIVISGAGFLTDASHPTHPGDFGRYEAALSVTVDSEAGIASIAVTTGLGDKQDVARYFVRRGRIFQVDDKGEEIPAERLGDISVAAVAALHPALVESAMRERREDVRELSDGRFAFSWNDVLWTVTASKTLSRVTRLTRARWNDVFGDGTEEIVYEQTPPRVTVRLRGRETARFEFGPEQPDAAVEIPKGDERRDRGHVIGSGEIAFTELAPHLFTIDLASISSRVTVAEFSDHLVVLEGAYSARNGDLLAREVRERLPKPVRYFAFSHLHGQYVGSTRSWVAVGATVIVPPTNALVVYNVPSEHTDEYFVFWFPGPKILLTGDLLFYRPGKPLTGRSMRLCQTVAELGLDVERYVATWPLDGFGTRNVVTGEEMKAGCATTTPFPSPSPASPPFATPPTPRPRAPR